MEKPSDMFSFGVVVSQLGLILPRLSRWLIEHSAFTLC